MKRKLFAIFTSVLMLCAMLPLGAVGVSAATSGITGDCTWRLDGSRLIISGNGAMQDYEYYSTLPWGRNITSISIEHGVTTIGKYAFQGCAHLETASFPDSVTTIGGWAFDDCSSLNSVILSIGVTTIEDCAFRNCISLTSLNIPSSVINISSGAFYNCSSLTAIDVDENNRNYCSVNGVLFNKSKTILLQYPINKFVGIYTVPLGVTTINKSAFSNCKWLVTVTIPNSVTLIDYYAFSGCSALTSISLSKSVTSIGGGAFDECYSLTDVYYNGEEINKSDITVLYNNDSLLNANWHYSEGEQPEISTGTTGDCIWTLDGTHLTISGNGKMSDYYYRNDDEYLPTPWGTSITSVTIEQGVTNIGAGAFKSCRTLNSVSISNSVKTIGRGAFIGCDSLLSIVIPNNVQNIGIDAFYDCTFLQSVSIGDGVTHIGRDAFCFCESLTFVDMGNNVSSVGIGAFANCASLHSIILSDKVTGIDDEAFLGCYSLQSVYLPASVTYLGLSAFYTCREFGNVDVYYGGSEKDKANIYIDDGNSINWHYTCSNPKSNYSSTIQHSVMDTDNGNGLAFRFELSAQNMSIQSGCITRADYNNATVNYLGEDCKLVGMGTVVTNDAIIGDSKFTLDNVNDKSVLNIPAVYLCDLEQDSCAFAVRIINIPNTELERTIYARPYYIVEVDGEQIVVYGDVDSASCAEYM